MSTLKFRQSTVDHIRHRGSGIRMCTYWDDKRLEHEWLVLALRTINELCQAYVAFCAGSKNVAYAKRVESCLRSHVLPRLAGRTVTSIERADIGNLLTELDRRHPRAANRVVQTVRRMFEWGKRAGLVPQGCANPAAPVSALDRRE